MRKVRLLTAVTALGLMASALTACGSDSSGSDDPVSSVSNPPTGAAAAALDPKGELAKAAKKEGSVTWYAPTLGNIDEIAGRFIRAYGVKINMVLQPNTQLQARFSSEAEAGTAGADVVTTGYSPFFGQALQKGWMTPLSQVVPDFPGSYPADYVLDNGGSAISSISATGIAYDSDKVSGADVPNDWTDLADPKWKGKIISVEPAASLGYLTFWDALLKKYGADTLGKIHANVTRTFATGTAEIESLTAGEGEIVLYTSAGLAKPAADKGAPVKFKVFDFTTGVDFGLGVSSKAPHPNAAKLFATWLMSTVGQTAFVELSLASTPLIPGTLPKEYVQPALTISDERKAEILGALGVAK